MNTPSGIHGTPSFNHDYSGADFTYAPHKTEPDVPMPSLGQAMTQSPLADSDPPSAPQFDALPSFVREYLPPNMQGSAMAPKPATQKSAIADKDPDDLPESIELLLTAFVDGIRGFDSRAAADRVILEAERVAQAKKCEMRAHLKQSSLALAKRMPAQVRSVHRSRIEARVSRIKSGELTRLLKGIIRWLVEECGEERAGGCERCSTA